jgi:hypothetical protein
MRKAILILFLASGFASGAQTFENYYPYLERGIGSAVFNYDNGYAMAGFTYDENDRSYLFILRTDLNGDTLWTKQFDFESSDKYPYLSSYTEDGNGNIYLATNYTDSTDLIKMSPDWDIIWKKRYEPLITILNITLSKDNHLLISGLEENSIYRLYKMDTDGNIQWQSVRLKYDDLEIRNSPSIVEMDDDKIVLVTVFKTNYTIDYNSTRINTFNYIGDSISSVFYSGYALCNTYISGNELVSIYYTNKYGDYTKGMIRFLSDGTILSDKILKMPATSIVTNLLPYNDNFLAVGIYGSYDPFSEQIIMCGITAAGDSLWTNYLGNSYKIQPYDVKYCNDNGFVITGRSKNSGDWIPLLFKTDSTGNFYNIGINDKNITSEIRVYPNPAVDRALFESSEPLHGIISIVDMSGRKIASIRTTGLKTEWNTRGLKPGMYFYKIENKGDIPTGKLIIGL